MDRYGNIFIFCSHYYRSKAIGTAEPGWWDLPARPGHLTWCTLVAASGSGKLAIVCRYCRNTPVKILETRTASLNSISCHSGSQRSCLKTGVMCSCHPVPVTRCSGAFCTACRRQRKLSEILSNSELQYSRQVPQLCTEANHYSLINR